MSIDYNEKYEEYYEDASFKISSDFIRNLIDEAMRKKDRTVSIFCSPRGTSISIDPLTNEN